MAVALAAAVIVEVQGKVIHLITLSCPAIVARRQRHASYLNSSKGRCKSFFYAQAKIKTDQKPHVI